MSNVIGGSVIWELDVDDSKLKKGLDAAKTNVASATSSIEKNTDGAKGGVNRLSDSFKNAEGASKAFAGVIATVGAGIIAAAGFAVKSAIEMENLRMSLDVMTGSAENGGKIFKELYDFAAKTPFETSNLAKATQTMLGFGISSKDVMGNLKMLGDVSMGNNDKLQSLTLAFSQMSSTGRLMGQDLLQMINGGFNPLTIIAQKTGKSMLELKDDMAAGLISTEMVTDAFKTATSEGGLFYQGMEKGSKTLSGTWSTLKDSIGMLARQFVGLSASGEVVKGGLVDKLKDGITVLSNALAYLSTNEGMKKIENFLNVMKVVAPIVAGAILGALVPAFVAWTVVTWAALVPLLPFIAAGAAIAAVIVGIIAVVKNWDKIMGGLKSTLTTVGTAIGGFFKSVGDWFKNVFSTIGDFIKNNWQGILLFLVNPLAGIFKLLYDNFDGFRNFIDSTIGSLKVALVTFFTVTIPSAIQTMLSFFASLPATIGTFLTNVIQGFTTFVTNLAAFLAYGIPFAIGFMIGFMVALPGVIWKKLLALHQMFVDFAVNLWMYLSVEIPRIFNNVVTWVSELPGKIWTFLVSVHQMFVNFAVNLWLYLSVEIPRIFTAIVTWISELPAKIWTWLVGVYTKFTTWGTNTGTYLSTTVTSWITNMVNLITSLPGKISSGLSNLGSTIKSSFSNAWNTLVNELQQWPSKIWNWGSNIAQSFVDGFKNALKNIGQAFKDGIESAKKSMKGESPPKEGPLKEIDKWGFNIGNAWTSGFASSISGLKGMISGIDFKNSLNLDAPNVSNSNGLDYGKAGNTQNVTIQSVNVRDQSDIDALIRTLGFKLSTI